MGRKDGTYGALRQGAVTDLAPSRAAQGPHFTHAVRREVVMEHETLRRLAAQIIDDLLVALCSQGRHHKGLRFTAGEQGRAVGARQHGDAPADRPHVCKRAAVGAAALFQNLAAHFGAFHVMQERLDGFGAGP